MFVDQVKIYVKAGKGGNGALSFRREKFVPRGGPDGGDGGNGGDIILKASTRLSTLLDLQYQQHHIAGDGGPGEGNNRHGRNAPPVVITVPVGTVAKDYDAGDILCDLALDGQEAIVAHAGRGGRGNARFSSSTNRVPMQHEEGTAGEERWLLLELKLIADVGLVGFPNAGKSTLISAISAARPKIADYPFTTLVPNLGVVAYGGGQGTRPRGKQPVSAGKGLGKEKPSRRLRGREGAISGAIASREAGWDSDSFVVADVPGLIEGAHEGKGLGFQFLRHIERTSYLLFLIDIGETAEDPVKSLKTLRSELERYNPEVAKKSYAVVGTKVDAAGDGEHVKRLRAYCGKHKIKMFAISAVTREGLHPLINFLGQQVDTIKKTRTESAGTHRTE
jgi:GTP-binding protein